MSTSAVLRGELGNLDNQFSDPTKIYNSALEKLGVGDARTRVQNLRGQIANTDSLIDKVDDDVRARTSGSLVTQNQLRGLITRESKPLYDQLRTLQGGLDVDMQGLARLEDEARISSDLELEGFKLRRGNILSRLEAALEAERRDEERRKFELQHALSLQAEARQAAAAKPAPSPSWTRYTPPKAKTPTKSSASSYFRPLSQPKPAPLQGGSVRIQGGWGGSLQGGGGGIRLQ